MRIARWTQDHTRAEGFVIDDLVIPFAEAESVETVLAAGLGRARELLDAADPSDGTPLAAVTLLAPLRPAAIRDFVAFEEHVEGISGAVHDKNEVVAEWYEAPTFYFTNPHTVLGPGEPVVPPATQRLDFELEIAVVIGGPAGANLSFEKADAAIFGYTILNDWSARDVQSREMKVRLGPAKGKDFGLSLGPWIVTADELAPFVDVDGFLAVRAEARVNGELVGHDLVSNMGWPFPELVMYASRNSRVAPGDVIGSGTVGNGGCLAELWGRGGTRPALQPGDEVELTVEGIGRLSATVASPIPVPYIPAARPRPRARSLP